VELQPFSLRKKQLIKVGSALKRKKRFAMGGSMEKANKLQWAFRQGHLTEIVRRAESNQGSVVALTKMKSNKKKERWAIKP